MPPTLDALLASLEAAKSRFGRGAASEIKVLLDQLSSHNFRDAKSLIRLHEVLLFLRAFPQSAAIVPRIERLLNTFHERTEKLGELGGNMSAFDDFDTSGVAGTTMQDSLNFEAARWLARRIPRNIEIAWDDYEDERAMGSTWLRFIPLLAEDADVEANIPWRRWLDPARGRERDVEWLISRFEQLDVGEEHARDRAELYDALRLPLRWHLKNLKLARTRNWNRPRQFYYHSEPLIARSQVSLADELAQLVPRRTEKSRVVGRGTTSSRADKTAFSTSALAAEGTFTKLSRREGESVMHAIREVMVVRYRELYGTTLGDPSSVVRVTLDRGIVMYFWNLPAARRLPLRAYVAGFTLKNGVPINYVEAIGLCEWIEVGFNTFYTYRQGETAWIYAQALCCLCAFTGATTISVYPYQIGQNNDEAIDSGAFWFYRKLGFRSGDKDMEQLARREEQKIAANPQYRSPKKILKRLAEAHVFYEVDRVGLGKGTTSSRAEKIAFSTSALAAGGRWDTFSTRNLGLRVNRRMASEFAGDSARLRRASVAEVSRALNVNFPRWNPAERQAFENWSLVLALIPNLRRWSPQEKQDAIKIIRAQAGPNEMRYLRLTQQHPRLREELLRLGSKR
jgi:hypothetical protein